MSYKPCRGSGIGFDKAMSNATHHRNEVRIMIEEQSYLQFSKINKFSKHIYLHYINEKKINSACIEYSMVSDYFKNLLIKNITYVYKPMQKLLKEKFKIN